jgi:hypothetical protein
LIRRHRQTRVGIKLDFNDRSNAIGIRPYATHRSDPPALLRRLPRAFVHDDLFIRVTCADPTNGLPLGYIGKMTGEKPQDDGMFIFDDLDRSDY